MVTPPVPPIAPEKAPPPLMISDLVPRVTMPLPDRPATVALVAGVMAVCTPSEPMRQNWGFS